MSSIEEKVIAEIRERAKKGEAKYGTTMDRDDLSLLQWLQHLKEELMDGVIYTQKIIDVLHFHSVNIGGELYLYLDEANPLSDETESE